MRLDVSGPAAPRACLPEETLERVRPLLGRMGITRIANITGLDMTTYWQPTAASYFGRVSKERIIEAVREGVSKEAADNIAGLKKQAMAQAAEERLAGKAWLPGVLRNAPADTPETEPAG